MAKRTKKLKNSQIKRLVDVNNRSEKDDDTIAVFESLVTKNMGVLRSFLKAGFDVNKRTICEETPLHWAVQYSPIRMIHELIVRGADINAQDYSEETPLVKAACSKKLAAICILLYYGADVNIVCESNRTPLMWAIEANGVEASAILVNFYCDCSQKTVTGDSMAYLAALARNPVAIDLIKASNIKKDRHNALLRFALNYSQAELFKLVWAKYEHVISINAVLLKDYISFCHFPNPEWVECLHLMFSSPVVSNHLNECQCNHMFGLNNNRVMCNLLLSIYRKKLDLNQRLGLIYLCLGFGVGINSKVLNYVHLLYGFNDELEAFLFGAHYQRSVPRKNLLPLPKIIFFLDDCFNVNTVTPVFDYLRCTASIRNLRRSTKRRLLMDSIGFCSLSICQKESIRDLCKLHLNGVEKNAIMNRLAEIPEVPSLIELSRNKARQFIKEKYNIKIALKFYDILRLLNLPSRITDILSFKVPLY